MCSLPQSLMELLTLQVLFSSAHLPPCCTPFSIITHFSSLLSSQSHPFPVPTAELSCWGVLSSPLWPQVQVPLPSETKSPIYSLLRARPLPWPSWTLLGALPVDLFLGLRFPPSLMVSGGQWVSVPLLSVISCPTQHTHPLPLPRCSDMVREVMGWGLESDTRRKGVVALFASHSVCISLGHQEDFPKIFLLTVFWTCPGLQAPPPDSLQCPGSPTVEPGPGPTCLLPVWGSDWTISTSSSVGLLGPHPSSWQVSLFAPLVCPAHTFRRKCPRTCIL